MFGKLRGHRFLFEELVKRDFKKKYKRTILGMGWSMLSPLLMLLVMKLVFEQFFGRSVGHYTTYLFCGLLFFNWFAESTNAGMRSLFGNASIFSKVNVPKYLFLFSANVQVLINFVLTLCVFFVFCAIDRVDFTWRFLLLVYPVSTMLLFCIGVGMVLSALFIFFRDIDYLWAVALQLLMYGSAIFYTTEKFSPDMQLAFSFNPVYRHIAYVREIVLAGTVPSLGTHLALLGFAVAAFLAGAFMYKRYNTTFLYYV
ncbi:MAG: ABC transporter permease [Kiritimatiellae bacterium]|nr:ABC transporter permease [Kiritimatiellia bacterium]